MESGHHRRPVGIGSRSVWWSTLAPSVAAALLAFLAFLAKRLIGPERLPKRNRDNAMAALLLAEKLPEGSSARIELTEWAEALVLASMAQETLTPLGWARVNAWSAVMTAILLLLAWTGVIGLLLATSLYTGPTRWLAVGVEDVIAAALGLFFLFMLYDEAIVPAVRAAWRVTQRIKNVLDA